MLAHQLSPPEAANGRDNLRIITTELENLSRFATELFSDLELEMDLRTNRFLQISQRAERMRSAADKQDSLKRSLHVMRTAPETCSASEKRFTPNTSTQAHYSIAGIFSKPHGLQAQRAKCDTMPDFSSFADSHEVAKRFSNPKFFVEVWVRTEQAKMDREEQARRLDKEQRKRKKLESGTTAQHQQPTRPVVVKPLPPPPQPSLPSSSGAVPARPKRPESMRVDANAPARPSRPRTAAPGLGAAAAAPTPSFLLPQKPVAPPVAAAAPARSRPPPPPGPVRASAPPLLSTTAAATPLGPMRPARAATVEPPPRSAPPPSPPPPMLPVHSPEPLPSTPHEPSPPVYQPAPVVAAVPEYMQQQQQPIAPVQEEEPPMKRAPPPPVVVIVDTPPLVQEPVATATMPPQDEDLKKFVMMQKMNLPRGAIEQAMVRAQVDPKRLFADYSAASAAAPITINRAPVKTPSPSTGGNNSVMSELLSKGAGGLKRVEFAVAAGDEGKETPPPASDLMQAILKGATQLKRVEPVAKQAKPAAPEGSDVASVLARRIAIIGENGSDSDSDAGSGWDEDEDD